MAADISEEIEATLEYVGQHLSQSALDELPDTLRNALAKRLRFWCPTVGWRTVEAKTIAILLGTGFAQWEVAKWLECSRQSVTRTVAKLRKSGLGCGRAQRPQSAGDCSRTVDSHDDDSQTGVFSYFDLSRLNWRTEYNDLCFRRRHICVGVGEDMERKMTWLRDSASDGKVTQQTCQARAGSKFNVDTLLERWWAGKG